MIDLTSYEEGISFTEENRKVFIEVVSKMITDRMNELVKIYGDDKEKIINLIKEEYKNICDIKITEEDE